MKTETRVLHRAGCDLAYDVAGEGPGVILLHPLTLDRRCFDGHRLRQRLVRAGLRVIAPDAIGHGLSTAPGDASRYAIAERVADVTAIADDVGLKEFGVAGYSMGGWNAMAVAALVPQRVTSLAVGGWDPRCGARTALPVLPVWFYSRVGSALIVRGFQACEEPLFLPVPTRAARVGRRLALKELFRSQPASPATQLKSIPSLFWCGTRDPYRTSLKQVAAEMGATFVAVPGNHFTAMLTDGLVTTLVDHTRVAAGIGGQPIAER